MNRSTFLQSLPFLHIIPTTTDIEIWKIHRDRILEYIRTSDTNIYNGSISNKNSQSVDKKEDDKSKDNQTNHTVHCHSLFSTLDHVISIEPNTMNINGTIKTKPAFFRPSGSNGSSSKNDEEDPALAGFGAYLLPAEISNGHNGDVTNSMGMTSSTRLNTNGNKHQSPISSSASTHMSTPQSNSLLGGKFEKNHGHNTKTNNDDGHDDINEEDEEEEDEEEIFKTHLLYFVFTNYPISSGINQTESNGEDENDGDKNPNLDEKKVDVYFVDYQSMQSLELISGSSPSPCSSPSKGHILENNQKKNEETPLSHSRAKAKNRTTSTSTITPSKPTSLFIEFDACNFRVFGKDFLHHQQQKQHYPKQHRRTNVGNQFDNCTIANYEHHLRCSFDRMKNCINSHKEKLHCLKYDPMYMTDFNSSSFYVYLSYMVYPPSLLQQLQLQKRDEKNQQQHNHPSQGSESFHESDEIEKALTKATEESTTTTIHESTSHKKDKKGPSSSDECTDHSETMNSIRKRKLKSYEKSWKALEKIQGIINANTTSTKSLEGRNENNNDNTNVKEEFTTLLQRSATELGESYVVDDSLGILHENSVFSSRENIRRELESKLSSSEYSIDVMIQQIFASSGGGGRSRSSSKRFKSKPSTVVTEEDIQRDLKIYRQTIAARHKLMFMPSR